MHSASRTSVPRIASLVLLAAGLAWTPRIAAADITISSKTSTKGLGGFANSTGTTTRAITRERAVDESQTQYSGFMSKLAGGGDKGTTQIVRLDKDLVWTVNTDKKQYSEMTFAQMREAMERSLAEMRKAAAQKEQSKAKSNSEMKDSDVKMEFELDAKRTGEKQSIAGVECEQVVVTALSKVKDKKTDQEAGQLKFTLDGWYAKKAPGGPELLAFEKAYAEKLGLEQAAKNLAPMATAMYGDALKQIGKKLEGVGYPFKSTFTVETVLSDDMKKQMAEAKEAQKKSKGDAKKSEKRSDAAQDASDAATVGSSAASGDTRGAKGAFGGFLGRKLAKAAAKKLEEKGEKAAGDGGGDLGEGVLLRTTTEVVSVSSSSVPEGRFEVPTGFKLVKAKGVGGKD